MQTSKHAPALAHIGAWSQLLLLVGGGATILRIQGAPQLVDLTDPAVVEKVTASIGQMTTHLGRAFDPFLLSFGLSMVLLTLFFVAVMKLGYRRPWAFYFSLVYGVVLFSLVPIGVPFGLLLIVFALVNHRSFLAQQQDTAQQPGEATPSAAA
jgi:hypothetical protein